MFDLASLLIDGFDHTVINQLINFDRGVGKLRQL